ncbi:MAG: ankyrin repeat domain-containing protein [Alphaproteobacteria bacterium]|nr:ankyrin repeat domain-containing protein [Alphaproteobacteria bacterium]
MNDNLNDSLADSIVNMINWSCIGRPYGLNILKWLVATGNVNKKSQDNKIPLHHCSTWCGNTEEVLFLIENGADINAQDEYGDTALHCAVASGRSEPVELLIKHCAKLDIQNNRGFTPLMTACNCGGHILPVEILIAHGVDLDLQNKKGDTALMLCAHSYAGAANFQVEIAEKLIAAGADLNKRNNQGKTALMIAQEEDNLKMVKLLKEAASKDIKTLAKYNSDNVKKSDTNKQYQ